MVFKTTLDELTEETLRSKLADSIPVKVKLPDAAVKELASAAAARKGGGVELCPSPAFKKLASLLPPYLLWRAGDGRSK